MGFNIDIIIYSYMFISSLLLFYNIFYMLFSNIRKKEYEKSAKQWQDAIEKQLILLSEGKLLEPKHKKDLEKKLTSTNQLIAYARALDTLRKQGEELKAYLIENYMIIQSLAYHYRKKEITDKAFFAFFISNNAPCHGKEYKPIMEILLSYLESSTVYCRENVLKALYAMGNSQSVENALQIINDRQWFHHQKLISDGLMTFTGDKEELAELLWSHMKKWDDNLMISVVQFITVSSDKFKERFFIELQSEDVEIEIRMAILRYYRRHVYEPVRPLLISYLNGEKAIDENMRIVTASVIDRYPGDETVTVLKAVLHHSNWYLRYNAASSLVNLEVDINKLQDVLEGEDRYAKEILTYMMR
ncbi:MAG: HEAT repeat domain-containing protein [Clostridiaceae bacterium]